MSTTREQDIETARQFYADLLAFEARMEAAGEQMQNRGRWIDAQVALQKSRDSLRQFIGERMTKDIDQAHVEHQRRQRELQPPLMVDVPSEEE